MQMTLSDAIEAAKYLASDAVVFPAFQCGIIFVVVIAYVKEHGWFRQPNGLTMEVTRSSESWATFNLVYGFLSVLILQVNNTTEAWKGFKTVVMLIDLGILFYLCFFNGWFRNKSLGIIQASKAMKEKK